MISCCDAIMTLCISIEEPTLFDFFLFQIMCTPPIMLCLESGISVYSAVMGDGRVTGMCDPWSARAPGVTEQQSGPGPRPSNTSVVGDQGHVATPEDLTSRHNERA